MASIPVEGEKLCRCCGFAGQPNKFQCAVWGSFCQLELRDVLPIWPTPCSYNDSLSCPMMEARKANVMPNPHEAKFWLPFAYWNENLRKGAVVE